MGAHSAPHKKGARYLSLIAAAILALLVWWVFFGRGDGSATDSSSPAPRGTGTSATVSPGSPQQRQRRATGTVETFEVFASRDPFAPLVASGDTGKQSGAEGQGMDGKVVSLLNVLDEQDPPRAQIVVDETDQTVAEGEVFADNFKLLSLSGDCASMLFGDDQFTICEGEEILK